MALNPGVIRTVVAGPASVSLHPAIAKALSVLPNSSEIYVDLRFLENNSSLKNIFRHYVPSLIYLALVLLYYYFGYSQMFFGSI